MAEPTFFTVEIKNAEVIAHLKKSVNEEVPPEYTGFFETSMLSEYELLFSFRDLEENVEFSSGFMMAIGFELLEKMKKEDVAQLYFSGKHPVEAALFLVSSGPWSYHFEREEDTHKFTKMLEVVKEMSGSLKTELKSLDPQVLQQYLQ